MNEQLIPLREQIDAIDEQLIALLKTRIAVVEKVGELKSEHAPHLCRIRSGREASMLKRIASAFKGSPFSAINATAIWRLIIGASTHAEAPLTISVLHTDKEQHYFWLAREYFGPCATIIKQSQAKRVISDVLEGKAAIGLVPRFRASDPDDWWRSLMQESNDSPKIFAHLPFVHADEASKKNPVAMAIAKLSPEETGDDVSFYVLHTTHDVSQHRLQSSLGAANLNAQWHGILSPSPDSRLHLIELSGYVDAQHAGFKQFTESLGSSLLQATFLGSYATPFIIEN